MANLDLTTVIVALLGGGGVALVATAFRGVSTLRTGARAREREAIDDLGDDRKAERTMRRQAERDRDYWNRIAMMYAGQLERAGIPPIPAEPVPPSERLPLPKE